MLMITQEDNIFKLFMLHYNRGGFDKSNPFIKRGTIKKLWLKAIVANESGKTRPDAKSLIQRTLFFGSFIAD
jgi:hypothetical protein